MENQIASLVGEICSLCYRITSASDKFTVFADWSGHVQQLQVRICGKNAYAYRTEFAHAEKYIHESGKEYERWGDPTAFLIELRNNLDYILEHDELPEGIAREDHNGRMLLA